MGYFETLAKTWFFEDGDGKELFFPRGVKKNGYIVNDSTIKKKIEKLLKLQFGIGFISTFLLLIVVYYIMPEYIMPEFQLQGLVFCIGIGLWGLGSSLWWRITTSKLVRGLPTTDYVPKLSWSDRLERVKVRTKSINAFFLWLGQIFSLIFVVACLYLLYAGSTKISLVAGALFFGFVSLGYYWALIVKYRS